MLLEFSYENFLSFKNKVTFSMVATTLRDRKVKAEETLFVDDLLVNVEGAKAVGINAIQVTKERGIVQIFSDWI